MTDELILAVEPNYTKIEFDRPTDFTITVRNLTGQVQAFDLSVVGLSSPFVKFEPSRLDKFPEPERTRSARLTVTVPSTLKLPAQVHVIGVKAQSTTDSRISRVAEIHLQIPIRAGSNLEVVPKVVTAGSKGEFTVSAVNEGNAPLEFRLEGVDDEGEVDFTFSPAVLSVPPFQRASAVATVKAKRPLTGQPAMRSLTFRSIDHMGTPRETTTRFVQKARLPKALLRLSTLIPIIAAGLVAYFFFLMPKPFTLADYAGQSWDDVKLDLEKKGLDFDEEREFSGTDAADTVIRTNPDAGTEVESGDAVIVFVTD